MKNKAVVYFGFGFLALVTALILLFAGYSLVYANKIYPNVFLADENFGGLSETEAKDKIETKYKDLKLDKISFVYGEKRWDLKPEEIELQYDSERTFKELWQVGRKASFSESLKDQILAPFVPKHLMAHIDYSPDKLDKKITEIKKELDIPLQTISFGWQDGQVKMLPGKSGQALLKDETLVNFEKALREFKNNIDLAVVQTAPKVTEEGATKAKETFTQMVSGGLVLKWDTQRFNLGPLDIQKWITYEEKKVDGSWELEVKLDHNKVKSYLQSIAKKIDKEPIDAKLTISDGKATVFQPHQDGYQLDQDQSLRDIEKVLTSEENSQKEVELTVKELKAEVRDDTIDQLGVHELIGEGSSSFKGSPKNRIHNITVGANLFNGVLIKPGDVFSFNQVLGEVSARRGFLPELVIKEDRLIPETGGGLCQVSTTMFRAAVYSGLDILERTPHSFRVRYYEPPVGLDATVYIPKPDLKFKNDTPGYILIQTKIEGSTLTFQFYGTKDGRTVEVKGPFTSGYRSPGPAKYIDDPSLPQGELKLIERAVPGLTATINWTVYKDGQVLHQKTFVSKYVPWPAKYKRGTGPAAQ